MRALRRRSVKPRNRTRIEHLKQPQGRAPFDEPRDPGMNLLRPRTTAPGCRTSKRVPSLMRRPPCGRQVNLPTDRRSVAVRPGMAGAVRTGSDAAIDVATASSVMDALTAHKGTARMARTGLSVALVLLSAAVGVTAAERLTRDGIDEHPSNMGAEPDTVHVDLVRAPIAVEYKDVLGLVYRLRTGACVVDHGLAYEPVARQLAWRRLSGECARIGPRCQQFSDWLTVKSQSPGCIRAERMIRPQCSQVRCCDSDRYAVRAIRW